MTPNKAHIKNRLPGIIISLLSGICLGLILTILIISPATAAGPEKINVDAGGHQKVNLIVGKSMVIESPTDIKKFAIAIPEQVEVTIISPRQVYLIGKAPGATNATLWGVDGTIIAFLDIEIMPDVSHLKEKIHEMLPQEKDIKVTASPDALVLAGTATNTKNLSQIMTLANAYAPKDKDGNAKVINLLEIGGVQQVMLEVRVSEMSRTLMRRLGVNFNYVVNNSAFGVSLLKNLTSLTSVGGPDNPLNVRINSNVNAMLRFTAGNTTWTNFIDALKENGLTKILAEPTLITTSGRTANFLAGGEYPIPVPGLNGTITIQYKTFGVGLDFTPTVLSNEKISMEVKPEVSDLDFTNALAISGYVVPSLTTRRVSTVIELADGQSFAIAGLLKENVREVVSKFPVLGDIPILGVLFRSTSFQKDETELVIIVTPHLVKPVDMAKQTLPTDAFVEPDDFEFYLLGSLEGRGEASPPSDAAPALSNKGGLDGDFGHITPK